MKNPELEPILESYRREMTMLREKDLRLSAVLDEAARKLGAQTARADALASQVHVLTQNVRRLERVIARTVEPQPTPEIPPLTWTVPGEVYSQKELAYGDWHWSTALRNGHKESAAKQFARDAVKWHRSCGKLWQPVVTEGSPK